MYWCTLLHARYSVYYKLHSSTSRDTMYNSSQRTFVHSLRMWWTDNRGFSKIKPEGFLPGLILAFRGLIQPTGTSNYSEMYVDKHEPIFSNLIWILFSPNKEKCDSCRSPRVTNSNEQVWSEVWFWPSGLIFENPLLITCSSDRWIEA